MKRTIIISAISSVLTFSMLNCALAAPKHTAVINTPSKEASRLLVLSAVDGKIKKTANGYTLTLHHVDPKTLWFADRPKRQAGFIPTSALVKHWNSIFKNASPNAAVAHTNMSVTINGQTQPMALELSQPKFIGSVLSFKVTLLKGDKIHLGQLHDVDLFIDNAPNVLPTEQVKVW